ncbi:thymidine phosphorylase [Halomonas almeriensis]|uniref:thymidine phosphorylase n=1 Tax=Halomonas almeriensis TaxID=308163 RepID=UPI0025B4BA58|nr:thymidine phosphorylase [Halomonas almeriensis]MDN3552203.1 thymidine phosphorylase [Halomonas almeriensis]
MLPQEAIRAKRDGQVLDAATINELIGGIRDGRLSDAQVGALAMAIFLNDMNATETVALTEAVRDSGDVLDWSALGLPGPVIDKHSTGGVGDVVSLILGPWIAACGGHVPMISGRGLGHTGGTLDKLESIPGYSVSPDTATFRQLVKEVGVAIIGQTADLAPADKRLYAVRDVTATVESLPLIVSSILGKKLACGLDGLVMDVKVGSGAFMPTEEASRQLAETIAEVASRAGTSTTAVLTDMSQPLAPCAGNALEVREALAVLSGERRTGRLLEVTRHLAIEMLMAGGLAQDQASAEQQLERALSSGDAAERFGLMVAGLGGPTDFVSAPDQYLPTAPIIRPVLAPHSGYLRAMDTRALGMAVVELGGGRRSPDDAIDHAVGLADIAELGTRLEAGQPLATLHARRQEDAERAERQLLDAIELGEATASPILIHDTIRREAP